MKKFPSILVETFLASVACTIFGVATMVVINAHYGKSTTLDTFRSNYFGLIVAFNFLGIFIPLTFFNFFRYFITTKRSK